MYVFCAARDVIALLCLLTAHAAQHVWRRGGGGSGGGGGGGGTAAPPPPAPPAPRHLLRWCAALGFTGVFANQLLFLKVRYTHARTRARTPPRKPLQRGSGRDATAPRKHTTRARSSPPSRSCLAHHAHARALFPSAHTHRGWS
jgi:hypothetical protein